MSPKSFDPRPETGIVVTSSKQPAAKPTERMYQKFAPIFAMYGLYKLLSTFGGETIAADVGTVGEAAGFAVTVAIFRAAINVFKLLYAIFHLAHDVDAAKAQMRELKIMRRVWRAYLVWGKRCHGAHAQSGSSYRI